MKAITSDMILTSASTRSDGSLGLRFSTPELAAADKTAFFELLNRNLKVLIQPVDEVPEELHTVAKEMQFKTPSQRLRAVLFVEFKQRGQGTNFDAYYVDEMNKIIEYRKSLLEPETR